MLRQIGATEPGVDRRVVRLGVYPDGGYMTWFAAVLGVVDVVVSEFLEKGGTRLR